MQESTNDVLVRANVILNNIRNFNCWEFKDFDLTEKDAKIVLDALELLITSNGGTVAKGVRAENISDNEVNN